MITSRLKSHPKSKVITPGYINVYSQLPPRQKKLLQYSFKYKQSHPDWDDTTIALNNKLKLFLLHQKGQIKLLDAGCGHGNYLVDENRHHIDWAVGVDVDPASTAKNICLDEIKISSLQKIPFSNNQFSVTTSLWVLEHLSNPQQVLSEIFRVTKPGGIFLAATPNKSYWLITLKHMFSTPFLHFIVEMFYGRRSPDIFPTHYLANTVRDLQSILNIAGFTNIEVQLNYDPSYTAINQLTYLFFNFIHQIFPSLTSLYPHIIISAHKPTRKHP